MANKLKSVRDLAYELKDAVTGESGGKIKPTKWVDPESKETQTKMKPQEFLDLTSGGEKAVGDAHKKGFRWSDNPQKRSNRRGDELGAVEDYKYRMRHGEKIQVPSLGTSGKKVTGHEGRHRSVAALEEGEEEIPVSIQQDASALSIGRGKKLSPEELKQLKGERRSRKKGYGFGGYEKDHAPELHSKIETKERVNVGEVDGTGKETRREDKAESKEEPLEELTDGELEEVEKKPIKKGKKVPKKRRVYPSEGRFEGGQTAIDNPEFIKNLKNREKGLDDVKEKLGKFKDRITGKKEEELTEGGAKVLEEAKRKIEDEKKLRSRELQAMYKGKRDTATSKEAIEEREAKIRAGSGDMGKEQTIRRTGGKKFSSTGEKRRQQLKEEMEKLVKSSRDIRKRMTDSERIQHHGRGTRGRGGSQHPSVREVSPFKRQDPVAGARQTHGEEKDVLPKRPTHRQADPKKERVRGTLPEETMRGSKQSPTTPQHAMRGQHTPQRARYVDPKTGKEQKNILEKEPSPKKQGRFTKVRESLGELKERIRDRKKPKELTGKAPKDLISDKKERKDVKSRKVGMPTKKPKTEKRQAVYQKEGDKPKFTPAQAGQKTRIAGELERGEQRRGGRPRGSKKQPKQTKPEPKKTEPKRDYQAEFQRNLEELDRQIQSKKQKRGIRHV